MRLRIEITTPKGQALATSKKLKPFILGFRKTINQVWANKADNKIVWIVDGDPRDILTIERNVALFDKTLSMILGNRKVQNLARLTPQQRLELKDMLENQTKMRIIKHYDQMPDLKEYEKKEEEA